MSSYSELYETFVDKVPGVDIRTIAKLETLGIETLAQLKTTGWKHIAEVSNIGEKKLIPLFAKVGIKLSEQEIREYREELDKVKVPQSFPNLAGSSTEISPQVLTERDMEKITEQVQPDITAITTDALSAGPVSVSTISGAKITLSPEQQKFRKMTVTSDMESFIKALSKSPTVTFEKIRASVLNSLDALVPTGARAHVKQWINLLESKVEGKKGIPIDSLKTPDQFKAVLAPLLDSVIDNARREFSSGAITHALSSFSTSKKLQHESIMNTIILYKIYIDSTGSGWDLDATTGQLGATFKDAAEFTRRMCLRLGIDQKKEDPNSDNMMRIKRCWSAFQSGQAVLLAGMPGSGKTYFSKAVGESMTDNIWGTLPYTRINVTGGLEPSDILGEWDYQAQILALETARIRVGNVKSLTNEEIEALRENIYTIEYFRFGPLSLSLIQGVPILIDEVNRGSADIQNTLLQGIDENEIVVPGIGRIKATPGFFVISTINEQDVGTTDLGAAFLRRVIYIYFDEPADYTIWVKQEYPTINDKLLSDMEKVRKAIKTQTTISSEIPPSSISAWARELINLWGPDIVLNKERIIMTLGTLLKSKADIDEVKLKIDDIVTKAGILR